MARLDALARLESFFEIGLTGLAKPGGDRI
jgi:hypothetical protein